MTEKDDGFTDSNGWRYSGDPAENGDCRKLVWLVDGDGMAWIALRAWHHRERRWYNGNEPERARALCWQDLPGEALRYWQRGKLQPPRARALLSEDKL